MVYLNFEKNKSFGPKTEFPRDKARRLVIDQGPILEKKIKKMMKKKKNKKRKKKINNIKKK